MSIQFNIELKVFNNIERLREKKEVGSQNIIIYIYIYINIQCNG